MRSNNININDNFSLKGHITLIEMDSLPELDGNGNIINQNDILGISEYKNTIVYVGRAILRDLMDPTSNTTRDAITYLCLGDGATDQTPASETDTSLLNQTHIQTFDDVTSPSSITTVFTAVVPAGTATGVANEFGLKTSSDILFSRRVIPPITKQPHIHWIIKWGISF